MPDNFTPFKGRQVDLLVLHPSTYLGASKVRSSLTDVDGKSYACTGIQKAAQHWTMEFFTTRQEDGSGTSFVTALRSSRLYSDVVVRQEFNLASLQAVDNLSAEYTDSTPDDERIISVSITSLTVQKGRITIFCKINTAAGDAADLILPVSLAPN